MKIIRNEDKTITLHLDWEETCFLPMDAQETLNIWEREYDSDPESCLEWLPIAQQVRKFLDEENKEYG